MADTLESSKGEWDHIIELLREAVESVGPLSSSTSSSPKEDSCKFFFFVALVVSYGVCLLIDWLSDSGGRTR